MMPKTVTDREKITDMSVERWTKYWVFILTFLILSCDFCLVFAEKKAEYPPVLPRVMMITWDRTSKERVEMYSRNKIDTLYRATGATYWSVVEETQGIYDFSKLRNSLKLAKDAGLNYIPTIDFGMPPEWFKEKYPDCLFRYSDNSIVQSGDPKISMAWLVEMYNKKYIKKEPCPEYDLMEKFIIATLNELKRWNNVIGVELQWHLFSGHFVQRGSDSGTIGGIAKLLKEAPQSVYLGGFDHWHKKRWTHSEPIPATWYDYKHLSADMQEYWQDWAEQANGEAAQILLELIHNNAPEYLIILRKHFWNNSDLATGAQINKRQFDKFFGYVKDYSSRTGWKGIMFDNDAFFDGGQVANSLYTKELVKSAGFLYMGEGCNNDRYDKSLIVNIKTVRPDAFSFIPYPGKGGEQIETPDMQEVMRLMKEKGGGDTGSIIIDDGDTGSIIIDDEQVKLVGDWKKSAGFGPFWGMGYYSDNNKDKGEKSAKYVPNLPEEGYYEVYLMYSPHENRATNVPVSVKHRDGEMKVIINQQTPPDKSGWVLLGKFYFKSGSEGYVEIRTDSTNGYVIADAVKWVYISEK